MIASRGSAARTSARIRSGIIGNASDVGHPVIAGREVLAELRDRLGDGSRLTAHRIQLARHTVQYLERLLQVGYDADLGREIAADL